MTVAALRLAGAALILLAAGSPAAASDPAQAPSANSSASETGGSAEAAKGNKPEERKVCRTRSVSTGSLVKAERVVCKTVKEGRSRKD